MVPDLRLKAFPFLLEFHAASTDAFLWYVKHSFQGAEFFRLSWLDGAIERVSFPELHGKVDRFFHQGDALYVASKTDEALELARVQLAGDQPVLLQRSVCEALTGIFKVARDFDTGDLLFTLHFQQDTDGIRFYWLSDETLLFQRATEAEVPFEDAEYGPLYFFRSARNQQLLLLCYADGIRVTHFSSGEVVNSIPLAGIFDAAFLAPGLVEIAAAQGLYLYQIEV